MAELVPILVKIRRKNGGKGMVNCYPDFNQIPIGIRQGLDWSLYLDAHGLGWHFDKQAGFGVTDDYNPESQMQYAATCVPEDFANAAVTIFPERVQKLDETAWESFYDARAHAHEETEFLDTETLQGLLARIQLEQNPDAPTTPPSAEILVARAKCLDPNEKDHRGIRKNLRKTWADYKASIGVTIKKDK